MKMSLADGWIHEANVHNYTQSSWIQLFLILKVKAKTQYWTLYIAQGGYKTNSMK